MSGGEWWNEDSPGSQQTGIGDYNPAQTAQAQNQLDGTTTYEPPGTQSPIDQYNYIPDPNAPGGYQTYGPGVAAPANIAAYSNNSGQYPNDQSMANSIANAEAYVPPTVDQMGFAGLNQNDQSTWIGQYGQNAAQYQYGLQNGQYQLPQGTEGFLNLPPGEQDTWYGTYGANAPMVWAQQSSMNQGGNGIGQGGTLGAMGLNSNFFGNYPSNQGGGTVAPSTPGTIGAGTAGIQYGYGVPYFGGPQQQINGANLAGLADPNLSPGYIPGSGTYNQFNLANGQLFGNIAGVLSNLNYGVGGPGDPTNGTEPQTPDQWIQGGKLFNWQGNMGTAATGTQGLDYIATLFGRSDTPSGIGTPAWNAPKQFWDGLGQAIAQGKVQPTNRGWAALLAKGYTPQQLGGQAVAQAQSVGVQANGQGSSGGGGTGTGGANGPMGAGTQAFNQQAAYLDYLTAMMNNVQIPTMQNQNQQFHDELAFNQAKQKFLEEYQNKVFGEGQRQFDVNTGLQAGQLTGMYNGQETLANQQFKQNTSLGYLNLLSQLRGPGDIFQYLKVLQGTPGGMKDIVNAAAGQYRMPSFGGGANVGTGGGADINSLLSQLNDPNYGSDAKNLNLPPPNQISARALMQMSPSQQQALMGAYESAGYNPQDVMAIFKNSLPQYAGGQQSGRVSLFGR